MPNQSSASTSPLDRQAEAQLSRITNIVFQIQRLQRELIDLTVEFRCSNDPNFDPCSNEALESDERLHREYVDLLVELQRFLGTNSDPRSVVTEDVEFVLHPDP
jgi:hypothetical protein